MKISDFDSFRIDPEPIEGCEIKCPECGEWSFHTEWRATEVYCEDCGTHEAMRCPKCQDDIDNVWAELESRS